MKEYKELLLKLSVNPADVTPEKSFTNDLGADSLDTVELIMEFEKNLEFLFRMTKRKIATVGDAISYIETFNKRNFNLIAS